MKIVHRDCTDIYGEVKVVEEDVILDEGFYTFPSTNAALREETHR